MAKTQCVYLTPDIEKKAKFCSQICIQVVIIIKQTKHTWAEGKVSLNFSKTFKEEPTYASLFELIERPRADFPYILQQLELIL